MRRRDRRLLLCLALGTVTTVAVAWTLAVRVVVFLDGKSDFVRAEGVWSDDLNARPNWWCTVKTRRGLTVVTWEPAAFIAARPRAAARDLVVDCAVVSALGSHPEPTPLPAVPGWAMRARTDWPFHIGVASARGWPMRALRWQSAFRNDQRTDLSGGFVLPKGLEWIGPGKVLPWRPILTGFAFDSLLYAATWCAVLAAPGWLRRAVRRRRGLCPLCAYNVSRGGHDRCPECGWSARHVPPTIDPCRPPTPNG